VFAASAYASLGGDGAGNAALFTAEENILELHHACIREQESGVIAGHKRRTRDHLVFPIGKKVQESLAELAGRWFHIWLRTLIGIRLKIQCRVNLSTLKSSILQESRLSGAFGETIRRAQPEALPASLNC
jgi:hypothetical protein